MNHTPHETRHTCATKLDEVEKYDKLRNKKNTWTFDSGYNSKIYKIKHREFT